jgi:hypothetical protein
MKVLIAGHGPVREKLIQLMAVGMHSEHIPLQNRLELAGYELRSKGMSAETFRDSDIVVGLETDALLAAASHISKKTLVLYDPHTVSEKQTVALDGIGVPIEAHKTAKETLQPGFAPYVFFGALCCFVPLLGQDGGRQGMQRAVAHEYYQNRNRHLLAFKIGWEGALPQRLQTV